MAMISTARMMIDSIDNGIQIAVLIVCVIAALMGLLLYASIHRLIERRNRTLPALILIFCLLEYALWTASCFWNDAFLLHPYYWFDFLLTVSMPFFLPAVRKAVAA